MHSIDTADLVAEEISPEKGLIIVADDFGISRNANKNILQLLQQGKLDRVAVIMADNLNSAETDLLLRSRAALDLHLTIPEFMRQENTRKAFFRRLFYFSLTFASGRIRATRVLQLWEEQILLFHKRFGRLPDGINSHEHLHFFPPYFRIALKLAIKYQIPYLRFAKTGIITTKNRTAKILSLLWRINKRKYQKAFSEKTGGCPKSSDFLVSLDWAKNPDEILKRKNKGTVEVICHPERREEFEALRIYLP